MPKKLCTLLIIITILHPSVSDEVLSQRCKCLLDHSEADLLDIAYKAGVKIDKEARKYGHNILQIIDEMKTTGEVLVDKSDDDFTHFIDSIVQTTEGAMRQCREHYRKAALILLDDVNNLPVVQDHVIRMFDVLESSVSEIHDIVDDSKCKFGTIRAEIQSKFREGIRVVEKDRWLPLLEQCRIAELAAIKSRSDILCRNGKRIAEIIREFSKDPMRLVVAMKSC